MRILHTVQFYTPHVGGSEEVVRQVSERLVVRGHDVTVATKTLPERTFRTLKGVKIEEFSLSGNAINGMTGEIDRYQEFLRSGDFDVMLNYAALQWASDLAFPLLPELPYANVFIPCGLTGLPDSSPYFQSMPQVMAQYDELAFHANHYRDTDLARQSGLGHINVIPNGASEEEFSHPDPTFREKYGIPQDVPLLLTVGNHTGIKGHTLVIEAFRRAHIGRAVLLVVGGVIAGSGAGCTTRCQWHASLTTVLSMGNKRVILLNPPRADVVAAFHAADLFVFGSNIEYSPLVLFETLAAGTPFVSTACGNAQEIAEWTGGGITIPTQRRPDGFVTARAVDMQVAIESLIRDPQRRATLAETGHQAWRERFTWDVITDQYEAMYKRAVEQHKRQGTVAGGRKS